MAPEIWLVTFKIRRQRTGAESFYQSYSVDVDPDSTVLDAIEKIWAETDRTLTFRHACHHSTCGACGMRINGREKLTCITTIRSVTRDGGKIKVDPLRNFPILSDLVVDMGNFYLRMEKTGFDSVAPLTDADLPYEIHEFAPSAGVGERLVDCIECGLCISACPASSTDHEYAGPAVLAGIQLMYTRHPSQTLVDQADHHTGLWRCHSAYECTQVCPAGVDPAWRIMAMRKIVTTERIKSIFNPRQQEKK